MRKYLLTTLVLISIACSSYSQNNYKETTLPELMQKASKNSDVLILDVRSNGEYEDTIRGGRRSGIGRIKGATNISIQDLESKPEALARLAGNKNQEVYVICSHSYRSRRISNLLLRNGFTNVTNVKGGMSEWYRNYDELSPYLNTLYENRIDYKNLAPSQLYKKLVGNEPIEFIGLSSPPRFFFDSLVATFYPVFPDLKDPNYFKLADSLLLLEKVKASPGKSIVLFNTVGGGTGDIAEWLARKGFTNIYSLVGSLTGFYEYLANYQPAEARKKWLVAKSDIQFHTPLSFCKEQPTNVQWIDMRHDTTFNKITNGTKLDYKTLKGAANFPFYKNEEAFVQQFPDKKKTYMLLPQDGYKGAELAEGLIKRGYRIGWLIGGIERWEWYTNNIPEFKCKDALIK